MKKIAILLILFFGFGAKGWSQDTLICSWVPGTEGVKYSQYTAKTRRIIIQDTDSTRYVLDSLMVDPWKTDSLYFRDKNSFQNGKEIYSRGIYSIFQGQLYPLFTDTEFKQGISTFWFIKLHRYSVKPIIWEFEPMFTTEEVLGKEIYLYRRYAIMPEGRKFLSISYVDLSIGVIVQQSPAYRRKLALSPFKQEP